MRTKQSREKTKIIIPKRMDKIDEHLIQLICCPITLEIFNEPVVAKDGQTYERTAIMKVLNSGNSISPITRQPIDKNLYIAYNTINIRDGLLAKYPKLEKDMYKIVKNHEDYKKEIGEHLKIDNYEKLFEYSNFSYIQFTGKERDKIWKSGNTRVIKYLIDNMIDLEVCSNAGNYPIHRVCELCDIEILKYIVNKGVNLNVKNKKGIYPVHTIFKEGNIDSIKFLIDKGVKINVVDKNDNKPIDLLFKNKNIVNNKKRNDKKYVLNLINILVES